MWKNSTIKRIMYPLTDLDPEDPAFAFHLLVSRGIPSQPVSNYIHGNGRVWRQNQSWLILKSKVLYHLLFPWLFLECYGTTWQICHFNVSISNDLSHLSKSQLLSGWCKMTIESAVSLCLRDKARLREREIDKARESLTINTLLVLTIIIC